MAVQITRVMADINTPTTLSGDSSQSLEGSFLSTDQDSLIGRALGDVGPTSYGIDPVRIHSDND